MAPSPTVSYIDLPNGGQLYAEKHPAVIDNADETPILYIHGFLVSSLTIRPVLPYLTHRTTIIYDLEGHGKSSKPTSPPTLDSLTSCIPLVLSHFGYPPSSQIDIVSYSMGGCLAIHFAAHTTFHIRTLILMAPPDLSEPKELWEATAQQIKTQRVDDLLLYCLSSLGTRARTNVELRTAIQKQLQTDLSTNRDVMAAMWDASASLAEYWAVGCSNSSNGNTGRYAPPLSSFAKETWVFWGKEDGQSDRGTCEAVSRLTNATIVPLDTGHFMSWEDPKGVGEELKKILDP